MAQTLRDRPLPRAQLLHPANISGPVLTHEGIVTACWDGKLRRWPESGLGNPEEFAPSIGFLAGMRQMPDGTLVIRSKDSDAWGRFGNMSQHVGVDSPDDAVWLAAAQRLLVSKGGDVLVCDRAGKLQATLSSPRTRVTSTRSCPSAATARARLHGPSRASYV
jgi:hypothetical protein